MSNLYNEMHACLVDRLSLLEIEIILPPLCLMLSGTYGALNYAGLLGWSLAYRQMHYMCTSTSVIYCFQMRLLYVFLVGKQNKTTEHP